MIVILEWCQYGGQSKGTGGARSRQKRRTYNDEALVLFGQSLLEGTCPRFERG